MSLLPHFCRISGVLGNTNPFIYRGKKK